MPWASEEHAPAPRVLLGGEDLERVRQILAAAIPQATVFVFGSRAHGRHAWRFSDLDLAVEGRLTPRERAVLVNAFEESMLPMLVDLVELGTIDAEFRDRIRPSFIPLQPAPAAGWVTGAP